MAEMNSDLQYKAVKTFYEKTTMYRVEKEILKLLTKEAKKIAKDLVDKYEIKQNFVQRVDDALGNKIVLITELHKINEK